MRKKVLCLVLAAILAASTLTGCSSGGNESSNTASSQTDSQSSSESSSQASSEASQESSEASEEPSLEAKTIQLMITGPGKQNGSDAAWANFNEVLQKYVPNTTVEIIEAPFGEYSEKFTQVLASGEGVDLAWVGWLVNKPQNINDGNLMALDDLMTEYGQGITETLGENVIELHRFTDGKLYYLPSWQGLCGNRRAMVVVTEIAQAAGPTWVDDMQAALTKWRNNYSSTEDLQKVLDEIEIYLKAAKDAGKIGAGINMTRVFGWDMCSAQNVFVDVPGASVGIQWGDNTFTITDGVDNDHYKLIAETAARWYKEGYIRSDIMSVDASTLTFPSNGEITDTSFVYSCDDYLLEADDAAMDARCGMDMTMIPIEETAYFTKGDATAYAIPYCADEPERAMMVLNAIYSEPEVYNALIYGAEGVDYTKNADGTITTSYSGADVTADDNYGIPRWIIGSCINALVNNGTDPDYYPNLKELEKTAKTNPFQNFSFDNSKVQDVCASQLNLYQEYNSQVLFGVNGDNWQTTYDAYVQARKDAGLDSLITELQSQVDDYVQKYGVTSW